MHDWWIKTNESQTRARGRNKRVGEEVPAQAAQERWQGWQSWPLKYQPSSQVMAHRDPCRLETQTAVVRQRGHDSPRPYATHAVSPRGQWIWENFKAGEIAPVPSLFLLPMPRLLLCACNKSVAYTCATSLEDIPLKLLGWLTHFFFTQHFTTWRFSKVFYGPKQSPSLTICLPIPDLLDLLHNKCCGLTVVTVNVKCCSVTVYVVGIRGKMNYTWIEGI